MPEFHVEPYLHGLAPDTRYRYEVLVKDERWGHGERWDWTPGATRGWCSAAERT